MLYKGADILPRCIPEVFHSHEARKLFHGSSENFVSVAQLKFQSCNLCWSLLRQERMTDQELFEKGRVKTVTSFDSFGFLSFFVLLLHQLTTDRRNFEIL